MNHSLLGSAEPHAELLRQGAASTRRTTAFPVMAFRSLGRVIAPRVIAPRVIALPTRAIATT